MAEIYLSQKAFLFSEYQFHAFYSGCQEAVGGGGFRKNNFNINRSTSNIDVEMFTWLIIKDIVRQYLGYLTLGAV